MDPCAVKRLRTQRVNFQPSREGTCPCTACCYGNTRRLFFFPPSSLFFSFPTQAAVRRRIRSLCSPFHFGRIHYGNKEKRSRASTLCRNPSSPVDGQKSRFKNNKKQIREKKPQSPNSVASCLLDLHLQSTCTVQASSFGGHVKPCMDSIIIIIMQKKTD